MVEKHVREAFEKANPLPEGIIWNHDSQYYEGSETAWLWNDRLTQWTLIFNRFPANPELARLQAEICVSWYEAARLGCVDPLESAVREAWRAASMHQAIKLTDLETQVAQLQAQNASLRAALKPFADLEKVRRVSAKAPKAGIVWGVSTSSGDAEITVEHLNEAINLTN